MRESSENPSRLSGRISEGGGSPIGEVILRSGELEQDDLFAIIVPNDVLDLPRVRLKIQHEGRRIIFDIY